MDRIRSLRTILFVLFAQTVVLTAQIEFRSVDPATLRTRSPLPSDARVVAPSASIVRDLRAVPTHTVSIPTSRGMFEVLGTTFALFTDDAVMISRTERGDEYVPIPDHALVRGSIKGYPGSSVYMAAFSTHVIGVLEINEPEGKRRFMICPDTVIEGRMANHIVYEVRPGQGTPTQCYAEELPTYQRQVDSIFAITNRDESVKGAGDDTQDATQYSLQLALDCTNSFYKNLGSSLTTSASSAIAITGACGAVYFRDANVLIRVPYLRVWTVADPYPGDIGNKLGRIREHWEGNMKHVRRSVTCLLSGEGGGGLAWVGVLCGGYGYNVSGVDGRVNFPAPNYIWDIDVTSHELGHNIGSSHTHNCGWNPPIDSCWNAEGGCYENTRARRGTIMSYCHLTNKGTELQFHPRVATLFNRVLSTTWCNAPVPTRKDTDVAVISINVPLNGAGYLTKKTFQPSAYIRNLGDKALSNIAVTCEITDLNNVVKKTLNTTVAQLGVGQTYLAQFTGVSIDTADSYLARMTARVANDQYATNDIMTRPFAIVAADSGSVEILYPNGGEKLTAGSTVTVRFGATKVETVSLQYSTDDGATWTTLQHLVNANASSQKEQAWVVPFVVSNQCLVRVYSTSNAAVSDVSNARFSIDAPLDLQAYDIVDPTTKDPQNTPLVPRIVVRNIGANDAKDVKVRFFMKWVRATGPCYDTTFTLPLVKARAQDTLTLAPTPVLADGVHTMELYVDAPSDTNAANDRFWREFSARGLTPPSDIRYEEGPNRVLLQWRVRASDASQRVEIWRGSSTASMQKIRTLRESVNTFVDDGLTNDATYIYALRVVKGSQQSVFTPFVYTKPQVFPGAGTPGVPEHISPINGTVGVPALTDFVWTSVQGGDQYEVQIALDNSFQDLEHVAVVRDPGMLTLPLEFNTTRRWRVRAMNQTVTGTWSMPATFVTTKNCAGKALSFNGNGNKASDATFTWNGGPVTIEYWTFVKRATLKASTTFMVGESDNAGNRFQAHAPWDDGRIYWDYGNINDKGRISGPLGDGNFDRWVHIALVSDGATFKAIYVNGEEVASAKDASSPTGLKELTIGGMRSNTWFNGMVDEFRIWTEARTPEEIRSNMNRRLPQASETSKIAGWWRLDEGSGITSKDVVRQRQLSLTSGSMWTDSEALVSCEDPVDIRSLTTINVAPVAPNLRVHEYELSWKHTLPSRGATWYELEVATPSARTLKLINNIPANSKGEMTYTLKGLPADSSFSVGVRIRNTYGSSDETQITLTTPTPCSGSMVTFNGNKERFTVDKFLYSGKAATVEYWSYIDPTQLMNSVSFSVGEKADDARRLQAHAPWGDKTLYWDYGDWRENGRVSSSYESNIGKWTHVALVSNGYDTMAIYLDGVLAKRSTFTGAPELLRQLTIGGNPHSSTWFKGSIRNFRLWNTMRSERQIANSMFEHITEPRPNLLANYYLDEGKGTQINDALNALMSGSAPTEPMWGEAVTSSLMHAPALVHGRRIVQRGDTARYTRVKVPNATYTWEVRGGSILSGQESDEILVQWNSIDSVGTIIVRRTFTGGCIDESKISVVLPVLVGIQDEENPSDDILIMPNPASDVVTIRSEDAAVVTILDLQGRVVASAEIEQRGAVTVPIEMFAQGTYIVSCTTAQGVTTRRLSVQR